MSVIGLAVKAISPTAEFRNGLRPNANELSWRGIFQSLRIQRHG